MTVTDIGGTHGSPLSEAGRRQFEEEGFTVVRGLLSGAEVEAINAEFAAMKEAGPIPGHFEPREWDSAEPGDPLYAYPRVLHPHQVSELSLRYLLDPRLRGILEVLLGEDVLAAQSMFYFKPPGARGQALHQDNMYLRVEPGTCVAAWIACDEIDRENGGLEVVPGTHRMDLFCPEEADLGESFTRDYVPPPPGLAAVPVDMRPGDVLFFNGSVVHGSGPNRTADRFRRSFICHYAGVSAEKIGDWYPTLTMDGERVRLPESEDAGPCGEFVSVGPH